MDTDDLRVRPIEIDSVHELDPTMFEGDGAPPDGASPDDLIHDNTQKAGSAAAALVEYAKAVHGESDDLPTLVADLIGDLHHLADALGVDIDAAIESGRDDYLIEAHGQR